VWFCIWNSPRALIGRNGTRLFCLTRPREVDAILKGLCGCRFAVSDLETKRRTRQPQAAPQQKSVTDVKLFVLLYRYIAAPQDVPGPRTCAFISSACVDSHATRWNSHRRRDACEPRGSRPFERRARNAALCRPEAEPEDPFFGKARIRQGANKATAGPSLRSGRQVGVVGREG
jgi:hypothetical protein